MNVHDAFAAVEEELEDATLAHGPFASPHEGHSVIEEEFDELWDEIKMRHQSQTGMRAEAIQLAAMAVRFLVDCVE